MYLFTKSKFITKYKKSLYSSINFYYLLNLKSIFSTGK